ncbi:MAG: hypothetical protein GC155_02320 [Alphaproteobacteria bacterium]|nr:hypothetical protein [Alphaproteobacteria bacterium]
MKIRTALLAVLALGVAAPIASAKGRMDYKTFPISDVMKMEANQKYLGGFKFQFGGGGGARINTTHTRSTDPRPFQSDESRCQRAFLNALIKVRKDAERQGGTGVVQIVTTSTATGQPLKSTTEYACIAGGSNARVYLDGVIVK